MTGPDVRSGPVPAGAIHELLAAMPHRPDWVDDLVDVEVAAREARRFKLDVSFALGEGEPGRLSINDKGEPVALRQRLRALFPGRWVEAVLAVSPPGEVQTTDGEKVGPGGLERLTVYLEELGERGERIGRAVLALAGVDAAPAPGCAAVALDVDAAGELVAAKDYALVSDPDDPDAKAFPAHPVTGRRCFLRARRFRPGGRSAGSKLLWMSEAHRVGQVASAWASVDRLRGELGLGGPSAVALDALRRAWRHAPGTLLYPDLVSLDRGAEGAIRSLVVYTSLR